MSDDVDAFGYRPVRLHEVIGVQVAEAKQDGTLLPRVAMWVRLEDGDRFGYALDPDLASGLASELVHWAARAREKHWE